MDWIEKAMLLHVVAGALSLVTGLLVFVLKKGTSFHIRIGRVYFWSMALVFITSVYVSVMKNNLFLLLIGFFSFYLVFSGIEYNKIRSITKTTWKQYTHVFSFGACFLIMVLFGLYAVFTSQMALGIILLVFGGIGASLSWNDVKFYIFKRPREPRSWMKEHIGRMTGSYIAAFTAFAVNNIHFLPPVVIWLLPTVLGTGVIIYYNRRYEL
jgi:uncharacterized membrane protein